MLHFKVKYGPKDDPRSFEMLPCPLPPQFALALSVVLCVLSGAQALPPFAGHGRWLILNWLLVTFLLFSEHLVKTFIPSIQPFSAAFPHV